MCVHTGNERAETTTQSAALFLAVLVKIAIDWYSVFDLTSRLSVIIFYFYV